MKLTVLGAAGATGIPLVEQALAPGHEVTALVQSGQKLPITISRASVAAFLLQAATEDLYTRSGVVITE